MKKIQFLLALLFVVFAAQAIDPAFLIGDDGLNRVVLSGENYEKALAIIRQGKEALEQLIIENPEDNLGRRATYEN